VATEQETQEQEPLTEEQRLERLEVVAQKRRLILVGLASSIGVLLLFLILGFVIQHLRIRDLEVSNEAMAVKMEELSQLPDQFQAMQAQMQAFTETMAGDSGMTPEQRFTAIERKQVQILTVQGNVIETFQAFLLSLSRMVRGSRSWSEDFRLYSEQIKEQNKTLRTKPASAGQ
jgi:uncharacterized protein (DUF1015 family)